MAYIDEENKVASTTLGGRLVLVATEPLPDVAAGEEARGDWGFPGSERGAIAQDTAAKLRELISAISEEVVGAAQEVGRMGLERVEATVALSAAWDVNGKFGGGLKWVLGKLDAGAEGHLQHSHTLTLRLTWAPPAVKPGDA